jgi:hypothetical protein
LNTLPECADDGVTAREWSATHGEAPLDPAVAIPELLTVRAALRTLKPRWREVLWYAEVEGRTPTAVGQLMNLSPHGASTLLARAREALRRAYIFHSLPDDTPSGPACGPVRAHVGTYVRGGLSDQRRERVGLHVNVCTHCADLVKYAENLNRTLGGWIVPLMAATAARNVERPEALE